MSRLQFRHYTSQHTTGFGFFLYDWKKQPTLDLLWGKNVYVAFWLRGEL